MAVCHEGAIISRLQSEVPVCMVSDAKMEASIRLEAHHCRMRDISNEAHDSLPRLKLGPYALHPVADDRDRLGLAAAGELGMPRRIGDPGPQFLRAGCDHRADRTSDDEPLGGA